jgi:hypothetical protein
MLKPMLGVQTMEKALSFLARQRAFWAAVSSLRCNSLDERCQILRLRMIPSALDSCSQIRFLRAVTVRFVPRSVLATTHSPNPARYMQTAKSLI